MLTIVDANVPQSCVFPRPSRPKPEKRVVGPIEEGWINFQPYFKTPVAEHTKPKFGTMPPFVQRINDIAWIRDTQDAGLELETVAQELARTGISSSSLDASRSDDEYGPTLADAIGPRDPVPYDAPDPALVRRIEWERFAHACSLPVRIFWGRNKDGSLVALADQKNVVPMDYAKQLVAVRQGRSIEDIENARERAAFYNGIGSLLYGVATGEHPTSALLNDEEQRNRENNDPDPGPKELGQDTSINSNEPGETALWPVTLKECALTIARGLPLSLEERRYLAIHWERVGDKLKAAVAEARSRIQLIQG